MKMSEWMNDLRKQKRAKQILSFPAIQLLNCTLDEFLKSSELQYQGMQLVSERCQMSIGIGMMDIVESIRGTNNCLIDLYDSPEDIICLNNEIYEAYKKVYTDSIHAIDKNKVLGYTGWTTLLSKKPYFISQCDFCCMISLDMFDEFVGETLEKEAQYIERSFYHLDGPGAIKHLDRIIECGFNGIQWVNGAGNKSFYDSIWSDIYKKI